MEIRKICESDAEAFLHLRKQILVESPFMLREPEEFTILVEGQQAQIQEGEFTITVAEQQKQIREDALSGKHLMLVAEEEGQLVGFLTGTRGAFKKNRHGLYLVIGILQAFTGQGIGTQLFIAAEEWARQEGITRLDLTVMTSNQAGIALYKKRGFEIEGTKRRSLLVQGIDQDEYFMAKQLL